MGGLSLIHISTGSVEIKGITYKYFDTGEANKGLVYNLIFNDNGVGLSLIHI